MGIVNLSAKVSLSGVSETVNGLRQVQQGFRDTRDTVKAAIPDVSKMGDTLKAFGHEAQSVGRMLADADSRINKSIGGIGNSLAGHARNLGEITKNLALVGAGASAALGVFAFNTAKDMDSLTRGLATTSKNADDLRGKLANLKEISKLPGIDLKNAVEAELSLESVRFSPQFSQRTIAAFGNALASAGRGAPDLSEVIRQFTQIKSAGKLNGEDLNSIASRVPQIRGILQDALGTANPEQINKMGVSMDRLFEIMVSGLEKMAHVQGGMANGLENFLMSIQETVEPLGKGVGALFDGAGPTIDLFMGKLKDGFTSVGMTLAAIGKSGVLDEVGSKLFAAFDELGGKFSWLQDGMTGLAGQALAFIADLPHGIKETGKYARDLFVTLKDNAGEAVRYIGDLIGVVIANISEAFDSVGRRMQQIPRSLEAILNSGQVALKAFAVGDFDGVTRALKEGDLKLDRINQMAAPNFTALSTVAAPKFKELPKAPFVDLLANQFADGYRFTEAIKNARGPLSDLPDNPTYAMPGSAGRALMSRENPFDKMESLLEGIMKDTNKMADELSIRRQAIGGGELARVGVTGTELAGYGGSGLVPVNGDYGKRSTSSVLDREYRRIVREETRLGRGNRP